MYEEAQNIFEYLPIRRDTPENDYINHLWQAFIMLDEGDEIARPFAVMPFHLLFMLTLQYKILRIAKVHKQASDLFFSGVGGRNREQLLSEQKSVFVIALINEKTVCEVFQLLSLDHGVIKKIKDLIEERNDNLAHAKGGIEPDPEGKISDYIEILQEIQESMLELNNEVAEKWLSEMGPGETGVEYIELHLAEENLCPADMQQGKLAKLDERLNREI